MPDKIKKKHILNVADFFGIEADTVDNELLDDVAAAVAVMKKKQFKKLDAWVLPILEAVGIIAGYIEDVPPSKFTWAGEPVKVKKKKLVEPDKCQRRKGGKRPGVGKFVADLILEDGEHTLDSVTKAVVEKFPDRDYDPAYRLVRSMIGAQKHPSAFERRWNIAIVADGTPGNKRKGIEETRTFTAAPHDWEKE